MFAWVKNNLFSHRSFGQVLVKNVFWLMSGEIVSRVLRAGVVIYAARILGAASYGAFAFAMAISNFLAIFADFGVTPILSREIARNPEEKKSHIFHGIVIKAALLAFNIIAVLFVIPRFVALEESKILFPLIALMLTFDSARDLIVSVFKAMERMEFEAAIKIFVNLFIALLGIYALRTIASSFSLMAAYVISGALGFILALFILLPFLEKGKVMFRRERAQNILSSAWPIAILALIGTVLLSTDMIMLGWLASPEELGFYAAAQRPIQLFYMFFGIVGSALFPAIMRLSKANEKSKLGWITEKGLLMNFSFALPMLIGGFLLREEIILLLYGSPYLVATASFGILLFTFILMVPTGILSNVLIAYNMQKKFFKFSLFTALVNIILNFILVSALGIIGAAFATLCSQALNNLFLYRAVARELKFKILSGTSKILVAGALMGLIIFALKTLAIQTMPLIGIGILTYFIFLLMLREKLLLDLFNILKRQS